jgi:putative copper export protein/methionine-rich copper-binding protein CopC
MARLTFISQVIRCPRRRIASIAFLMLVAVFGVGLGGGVASAGPGAGPVVTEPADNTVIQVAPSQIVVRFPVAVNPLGSTAVVYSATHTTVASGPLSPSPADPTALVIGVPKLDKGVYTAVWSLADGQAGNFAFQVDPSGASPVTVTRTVPDFPLSPVARVLIAWVPMVAVMIFVGTLMIRFVVTSGAARRIADSSVAAAVRDTADRRLLRIGAVAVMVFLPATVTQAAFQAGKGTVAYSKIWDMVTADGSQMWMVRLIVTALAALLVVLAAIRPPRQALAMSQILLAGLALGLVELLARVLPSSKPADVTQAAINSASAFGHLVGSALWIGGMVALVALALPNVAPAAVCRPFWFAVIRRFSTLAMISVVVLTMSGLWLYWKHVGDLSQLITTVYGQTLTLKLILFGGLLLLGAIHQFWLLPRMEIARATGNDGRLLTLVTKRFQSIIVAEVVLGLAVLFVVPFLSGSARSQDIQTKAANLTQTAMAGPVTVSLTFSGLQPGLTDYNVAISDHTPARVVLSFASDALRVPRKEVLATALGGGRYRVSGFYTPMAGDWQVTVAVAGQTQQAAFTENVTVKPAKLPKAPPVTPTWTTWAFGAAELLLILLTLLAVTRVSRRMSTRAIDASLASGIPEQRTDKTESKQLTTAH